MPDGIVNCVVCNQGSHREDWQKNEAAGKVSACDSHSAAEVAAATAKLKPATKPTV